MSESNDLVVSTLLNRFNINEEEMSILFEYFIEKYIEEKCSLSTSVNTETSYEGENMYVNVSVEVELSNNKQVLLSSSGNESTRIK